MTMDNEQDTGKDLKRRIRDLLKEPENQRCSECFSKKHSLKFLAVLKAPQDSGHLHQLGVFCCNGCHAHLEALGQDFCTIKSLKSAEEWTEQDVLALEQSGNLAVNNAFLATLEGNHTEKHMGSLTSAAFVESKYKQRLFFSEDAYQEQMQLRAMIRFAKDQKPIETAQPTTNDKLKSAFRRQKTMEANEKEKEKEQSTHSATSRHSRSSVRRSNEIPRNSTRSSARKRVQRVSSFRHNNETKGEDLRRRSSHLRRSSTVANDSVRSGRRSLRRTRSEIDRDSTRISWSRSRSCSREQTAAASQRSRSTSLRTSSNHLPRSSIRGGSLHKRSPLPSKNRRTRSTSKDPIQRGSNNSHRSSLSPCSGGKPRSSHSASGRSPPRPASVRAISKPRPTLEGDLDHNESNSSLSLDDAESLFGDSFSSDSSNESNSVLHDSETKKADIIATALALQKIKAQAARPKDTQTSERRSNTAQTLPNPNDSLFDTRSTELASKKPYQRREMILDAVSAAGKEKGKETAAGRANSLTTKKQVVDVSDSLSSKEPFQRRQMMVDAMDRQQAVLVGQL